MKAEDPAILQWALPLFRLLLASVLTAGVTGIWVLNERVARVEAKIDSHLTGHPDTRLSRRIDRLEDRVRELEIGDRMNLEPR